MSDEDTQVQTPEVELDQPEPTTETTVELNQPADLESVPVLEPTTETTVELDPTENTEVETEENEVEAE